MAEINIHPNLALQQNLPAPPPAPVVPKKGMIGSFFSSAVRAIRAPYDYGRYIFSPYDSPNETLRRIDAAADRGIQRAKIREVQIDPIAPQLHADLDRVIEIQKQAVNPAQVNIPEVGQVADIAPLVFDPEVTRAPHLQARVDATDWKKQIEINQDDLSRKLSAFTALMQMCARSGCGKEKTNNLALMNLVKRATEGTNRPTVWELFTSHYELTFFQKLQAAWFYWIYYQTSLITNTVEAYLGSFIKNMTDDLMSSDTRTQIFRGMLQNANQFLIGDIQATKDFANEKADGDLEDYRNRAIERHYGFSLAELCKTFSEKRVEKDSPRVPFFKDLQKIPLLGWAFSGFEWFVNRFIIQSAMRSWILPNALESAVNKGFEATQPHNLPFTLSLTRFFTERLEQLQAKLRAGLDTSSKPSDKFPGTEALPETIKYLKLAIALEDAKTPLELRRRFTEIEKNKKWGLSQEIAEQIENSIIESGDILFRYLNETAESGELFARALKLSAAPFSGRAEEQATLEAEYKEEQAKLKRTAESVFKEIVDKSVAEGANKKVYWWVKAENPQKIATDSFDIQKTVATRSVEELSQICTRMAEKIEQSREVPTAENNVQTDIASLLQIMQVLASRKELQEELENIKGADRNTIWSALTPLYERVELIQERVLHLQELQDHYPSHATVVIRLREMKDLLKSIKDQFHAQPRHLQNPLIQSLGNTAEEIAKCLGAKAPVHLRLQGFIAEISQLSECVAREQQAIDAIHVLYPPRDNVGDAEPEGLLDMLLNYERGVHPRGFKPQACLTEIGKNIAYFPAEERIELERLIGNGSNLKSKWVELGHLLQRIYTKHMQQKNRDKTQLDHALDQASAWVQEKTLRYEFVKEEDHTLMQGEMGEITSEVAALQRDVEGLRLNLSASISVWAKAIVAGALAPIGYILGGPAGLITGSLATGGFGKLLQGIADAPKPDKKSPAPSDDNSWRSIAIKTGTVCAGAAATYWYAPVGLATYAGSALTAAYAGWNVPKVAVSKVKSDANTQVTELFENAYKFVLRPRIYKAATTRVMKVMST